MPGEKTPRHIAFIMDGNRRWARERGRPVLFGHREGSKALERVIRAAADRGVEFVTFYTLSTENLRRDPAELDGIFSLVREIPARLGDIIREGVRVRTVGDLARLPADVREVFEKVSAETAENKKITVTFAVAYGGRDEIVRAARRLADSGADFTEENFAKNLDAPEILDVDLVVRTGRRARISNFLLWEMAYAEIFFTDKMWPEMDAATVDEILAWFGSSERTFGK